MFQVLASVGMSVPSLRYYQGNEVKVLVNQDQHVFIKVGTKTNEEPQPLPPPPPPTPPTINDFPGWKRYTFTLETELSVELPQGGRQYVKDENDDVYVALPEALGASLLGCAPQSTLSLQQ